MSDNRFQSDLLVAGAMADAARAAALPHFRAITEVENKLSEGFDPVTIADRESELAMRDHLATACPDDGILGEEFGIKPARNDRSWTLDPVDGTRAFIAGLPTWTVLIALNQAASPVVGVIDQPYLGERFRGWPGGADLETSTGRRSLRTRSEARLADSILATTDPYLFSQDERGVFDEVRQSARLCRYGYDAYAYAMLALGSIDLVIESGLQPYDVQALIPVVQGAGGVITNWTGGCAAQGGQVVAAANSVLHTEALDRLASAAS